MDKTCVSFLSDTLSTVLLGLCTPIYNCENNETQYNTLMKHFVLYTGACKHLIMSLVILIEYV